MNKKNREMLVKTHKRNNTPVAKLGYVFDSTYAGSSANLNHFYGKRILYELNICVGAQVCLETVNIEPCAGLFVGAIGRVVEIVYDKSVGPNTVVKDHLPKYVVVDIPSFKPPPGVPVWDRKNPTVSVTVTVRCAALYSMILDPRFNVSPSTLHNLIFYFTPACANKSIRAQMQQRLLLRNIYAHEIGPRRHNSSLPRFAGRFQRR